MEIYLTLSFIKIVYDHFSEVKNPILMSYNSDMCESRWCEQGCDENTGRCICRKGYKLDLNEKCAGK